MKNIQKCNNLTGALCCPYTLVKTDKTTLLYDGNNICVANLLSNPKDPCEFDAVLVRLLNNECCP